MRLPGADAFGSCCVWGKAKAKLRYVWLIYKNISNGKLIAKAIPFFVVEGGECATSSTLNMVGEYPHKATRKLAALWGFLMCNRFAVNLLEVILNEGCLERVSVR